MGRKANKLPPIVLVHGWGGSYQEAWVDNGWEFFFEGYEREIIKINLLGHGVKTGSYDPQDYKNITQLVEEELAEYEQIDAMGYSLGAKIVLDIACRDTRKFRKIVLASIGVNAFGPLKAAQKIAELMESGVREDTPPLLKELYAYTKKAGNDPLAMAACMRRPQEDPITKQKLKNLACDVLVAVGDQDSIVLPVEPLTEEISNCELSYLEGVGHFDLLTHPEFIRDVNHFLSKRT